MGITEAICRLDAIQNERELSYPAVLKLEWSGKNDVFLLELSETPDFSSPKVFECSENFFLLENCKTNQTYYWRVNGSEIRTFTTKDGVRFLHIEGLRNIRDLGSKYIKQGYLFRGCEPAPLYTITEKGKHTFCKDLNIKTQLDLRGEFYGQLDGSPCGQSVSLKQIPYRPYKEIIEEKHKIAISKIIKFLSQEEHYPIYFHCQAGADRTGMIAFYIKTLLGEPDEDIFLDYELSSLSRTVNGFRSIEHDYFVEFLDILRSYAPNGNLREQVQTFLLDCGVKQEWIDEIIRILKK